MKLRREHRQQIERALGRALRGDELVRVASLANLTPPEYRVATALARTQLVLCALYLQSLAKLKPGEASAYIDRLLAWSAAP